MLETLDYTIRIGSTLTFLYFDLCLYSRYAVHYVFIADGQKCVTVSGLGAGASQSSVLGEVAEVAALAKQYSRVIPFHLNWVTWEWQYQCTNDVSFIIPTHIFYFRSIDLNLSFETPTTLYIFVRYLLAH